ncbi:Small ribosomal subunit protein eS21y [Ranunculus cassubicifolius]
MQNEGATTDLYIPRKCSINVGHIDENGLYTGQFTTFALCGFVRAQGDADGAIDRLCQKKKVPSTVE